MQKRVSRKIRYCIIKIGRLVNTSGWIHPPCGDDRLGDARLVRFHFERSEKS